MKKTFFGLILVLTVCLLSSCVFPTTNMIGIDQPNSLALPDPLRSDKALVYIVRPYKAVNVYLVVDAAGLDGWSETYIQSLGNNDQRYLGFLPANDADPLCVYLDPGRYQLKFFNTFFTPGKLFQPTEVEANKVYFYGLYGTNFTGSGKQLLQFQYLTENQGKNYLSKAQKHPRCLDFSSLPREKAVEHWDINLQIINASHVTYVITEKTGQKKTIALAPDQKTSYHWEWGETVLSEDGESGATVWENPFGKTLLFRNQAKEVENEIDISSATRNYNKWSIGVLSRSSPFVGILSNKFDALLMLTPDCRRSSSNKFDYTTQCTVKIVDSVPSGLRTTDYVQLR